MTEEEEAVVPQDDAVDSGAAVAGPGGRKIITSNKGIEDRN
jgi:hypothetical protein